MLMNCLDEEVAEHPRDLLLGRATGKILCNWDCYQATVRFLKELASDQTLLIQSGKPIRVLATRQEVPRVLIASPAGQLVFAHPINAAPASWTSIGVQESLNTAFLVFDAISKNHFGGDLAGKLVVCGGMGAAGGALPLAAGMLGAAFLGIEVDGERIRHRIRLGYCDYCVNSLDEALRILKNAVRQKQAVSVGLVGNCAEVIPELAARGVVPDILTDQTSTHDLLNGYVPSGLNLEEAVSLRRENPEEYLTRVRPSISAHFRGMLALQKLGSVVFEFGNNIRAAAGECGVQDNLAFPGFAENYLRQLFYKGLDPVRWVALSGARGDIHQVDDLAIKLFPDNSMLDRWIALARKFVRFQGLPARVCWLRPEERIILAESVNQLVAERAIKAPMVIAFDHVENRPEQLCHEKPAAMTEMNDANDAIIPRTLIDEFSGASWVAIGFGTGYCQATLVLVLDGSPEAAQNIRLVLKNDYAVNVVRLAATAFRKPRSTQPPQRPKARLPKDP